jgi:hypothetical protein
VLRQRGLQIVFRDEACLDQALTELLAHILELFPSHFVVNV